MKAPVALGLVMLLSCASAAGATECDALPDGPGRDAVLAWTAMEIDRVPACVAAPEAVAFTARVDLRWTPWRQGPRFVRAARGRCWLQPHEGRWRPFSCDVARSVTDERSGATFGIGERMDDSLLTDVVGALAEAPGVDVDEIATLGWVPIRGGGRWEGDRDGWRVELRDGRVLGLRRDCTPTPCVWSLEAGDPAPWYAD